MQPLFVKYDTPDQSYIIYTISFSFSNGIVKLSMGVPFITAGVLSLVGVDEIEREQFEPRCYRI